MVSHIALYRDAFLKALPPGVKLLEAASAPDIHMHGFDISSVAVANPLLSVSGHAHHVNFEVRDALMLSPTEEPRSISRHYCTMVADHLDDPRPLVYGASTPPR